MLIFLSFLQSKITHSIPAYSFWEYYIKNGIEEAGYEWAEAEVDWAEGLVYHNDKRKLQEWKTIVWEKTIKDIATKHALSPIALFLSYLYPHQVDEQAIKTIQNLGIPCVNFFCDNVREFTKAPKEFSVFDLNWVPEYKALGYYKEAGYSYVHLPMPMWVEPKNRIIAKMQNSDVSFIGSKDIQRWLLFEELADKGCDIKIYGAGWDELDNYSNSNQNSRSNNYLDTLNNQVNFIKRFGTSAYLRKLRQRNIKAHISNGLMLCVNGKIDFAKYISITQQSMITLGVNRYPSYLYPLNRPNTYSRLRDIEAPMLGACYLTEWTEGLDEMYEIGKEIEVYKNTIDLIDKMKYLTENEHIRNQMKLNGQKKALKNHSIQNTINLIIQHLVS